MNINAFMYLFLTILKFSYSKVSDQCSKSNTFWYSLKYPYIEILKLPSTQSSLITCPQISTQSCCSPDMNKDMASVSELKLKGFAEEKLESILMMFSNDSYDLMNIYLKDLENTKNDLNQLFSTTYGYNYKVHKDFFFKWFDKLKLYMQGRLHNIGELLDNFFLEMAQRIVRILIAPDSTPEITACRTARLIESKPYQETDVILKKKIIRSYPPARLLVNGIAVGRDVFNELIKDIQPSSKCVEQFNSAFHCMLCQGLTLKSCSQTCNVVIDNCFGSFKSSDMKKLDRVFSKYIKVLLHLAIKLDNPFNFPEVNNKMNVQISTAIMNVQTTYPNVKEQINAKCQGGGGGTSGGGGAGGGGGLPLSRRRRQASQEFYKWQNVNNNNNNAQKPWWEQTLTKNANEENNEKKDLNNYQSKSSDALSPFARRLKQKYKILESFFKDRKTEFCSSLLPTNFSADCWNGTKIVKNTPPVIAKESKKKNERTDNPTIKNAIVRLTEITKRIHLYLTDKNSDPETLPVQEYKIYVSKKVNAPNSETEDKSQSQVGGSKIDGSGELENVNPPPTNVNPEKPKKVPKITPVAPPQPDKGNGGFPTWSEGSGDTENKLPDIEKTKKPVQLPTKPEPVTVSSSTHSTVSTKSKMPPFSGTKSTTTVIPIAIPDDEDLNPPSPENRDKNNLPATSTTTLPTKIEGSGNQPVLPDMPDKKPPPAVQPTITTTTPSPDTFGEGSGEETKPKPPINKPDPALPMLPDSSTPVTNVTIPKPDPNPDSEKTPIEGSGRSPEQPPMVPSQPPIDHQPVTPPVPAIVDSTKPSIETLAPDQYPGKVPPEVWLPGIQGARNEDTDGQRTTPSGRVSSLLCRLENVAVLILLSIVYSHYSH